MTEDEMRKSYARKYNEFSTNVNFETLKEKLFRVPGEKAYWADALSAAERRLVKLQSIKDQVKDALIKQKISESPVVLTKSTVNKIENESEIIKLENNIKEVKMTIKQLEKIYDCVKYIAKDFENIINYIRLQDGL